METIEEAPAQEERPARTGSAINRCTQLLADYAERRDPQDFDQLARLAGPFLETRASFEIARIGLNVGEGEVVQEALLNVFRYAHTFRPLVPHAFSTWAARIVRNVALRFLRGGRTLATISLGDVGGQELLDRRSPEPIHFLIDREEREELSSRLRCYLRAYYGAFRGLTGLQRDVLERIAIQGSSYRDVADQRGMRVEAVKMVIYRARRRLAAEMARAAAG
ncbi:MAG: RNA polymerase sigma factor [Planctomycetota bacterium]